MLVVVGYVVFNKKLITILNICIRKFEKINISHQVIVNIIIEEL
jgi:hypothetical protein